MNLADILTPEQILPDLQATNRWEAIDELIRIFKQYMSNLDIPAWLEWLLR